MNNLISKEQAIEEIKSVFEWHDVVTMDRLIEHIKTLSSAQKTGHWIAGREIGRTMLGDCIIEIQYDGWTCSECHCLCEDSTKPTYKFCPNCGARMEREEE